MFPQECSAVVEPPYWRKAEKRNAAVVAMVVVVLAMVAMVEQKLKLLSREMVEPPILEKSTVVQHLPTVVVLVEPSHWRKAE